MWKKSCYGTSRAWAKAFAGHHHRLCSSMWRMMTSDARSSVAPGVSAPGSMRRRCQRWTHLRQDADTLPLR